MDNEENSRDVSFSDPKKRSKNNASNIRHNSVTLKNSKVKYISDKTSKMTNNNDR
jgi:hypothetical protein